MEKYHKNDDGQTVTFDESITENVIDGFGWVVAETGIIMDGLDPAPRFQGPPVHIDELAGIVEKDGEPVLLRNNFCDIVNYAKYQQKKEE